MKAAGDPVPTLRRRWESVGRRYTAYLLRHQTLRSRHMHRIFVGTDHRTGVVLLSVRLLIKLKRLPLELLAIALWAGASSHGYGSRPKRIVKRDVH